MTADGVALENLRLQLDDIEYAVTGMKGDLLKFLQCPAPVRCEVCGLAVDFRRAVRDQWRDIQEEGSDLLGVCPDCHAKGPQDDLPEESIFCVHCTAVAIGVIDALRSGWQCIADYEGNHRGNYAGCCPSCLELDEPRPGKIRIVRTLF